MNSPRKLILKSSLALGDIVCMTTAVRELHGQRPGEFLTDVRTPFPELWENNPHITTIADDDPQAEQIEMHYDRDAVWSVNQSNQHAVHLAGSYCQDLANSLGIGRLHPRKLAGDIHLSKAEWSTQSIPHQRHNCQRFWLINAGGKSDFSTKWIPASTTQRVVDYFAGRIQFVQVGGGGSEHHHPTLNNVINLVGQTTVRQLIQLVHSSCGVVCGVTGLMHLAAAVPCPTWQRRPRPCVVVAGGREPRTWYSYPTHRILETVGSLSCCSEGGCWQSLTFPAGEPGERLCHRVVNGWPKCMTMIRPESIILEIERILEGQGIE